MEHNSKSIICYIFSTWHILLSCLRKVITYWYNYPLFFFFKASFLFKNKKDFCSSFIYYILTIVSLPSTPSLHPLSLRSTFPFLLKKKTCLPGLSTEHGLTSYGKTEPKPSYQGWTKQPSRRKRVLSAGKRVRDTSTVESFTRTPNYTMLRYMLRT